MNNEPKRFEFPFSRKGFKAKLKEWLKRFLPAELFGSALAITASYLTFHITRNQIATAYAAAIADTTGFYVTLATQSTLTLRRQLHSQSQRFLWKHLLQVFKHMLLEFGPAELLDSFLLRPFFMWLFPILLYNYAAGVLVGKVVSDICFYIPVIMMAEWRAWSAKKD
jgi:hypothetical protein